MRWLRKFLRNLKRKPAPVASGSPDWGYYYLLGDDPKFQPPRPGNCAVFFHCNGAGDRPAVTTDPKGTAQ